MSNPARLDLAREIHDGIAQDLVALGYELDISLGDPHTSAQSRVQLRTMRFRVDQLIAKVRREMYELRDPTHESVQESLRRIAPEVCGHLLKQLEVQEFFIPEEFASDVTAIATELLRNSVSHSRASEIELHLSNLENHIYLEVRDNGKGGVNMESSRLGLIGMQERISAIGGTLSFISNESGSRFSLTL